MSNRVPRAAKYVVSTLVLLLVLSVAGRAAESAVGNVLQTVNLPEDAQCDIGKGTTTGTALAIVQGSKVGFPEFPILLVTSCTVSTFEPVFSRQAKLFFIDPGHPGNGGPSVVKTIDTTFTPPNGGWEALALRVDTGDLLACGEDEGQRFLYAIDISIFNSVQDGTATFLRNSPPAGSTCAGVAWDVSNKTIFQTSNTAEIFHFPVAPTGANSPIPSGCPSGVAGGLALAGPSLFVACLPNTTSLLNSPASQLAANPGVRAVPPGFGDVIVSSELEDFVRSMDVVLAGGPPTPTAQIRQINKANGAFVRTFTGPIDDLADLECDAASFGASAKDAVWVKDAFFDDTINAVEIPAGTCSLSGNIPLLGSPGACPFKPATPGVTYPTNPDGSPLDTDGDGLLDCQEDGAVWAAGSPYVTNPPDAAGQGRPGIDFDGDGVRDIVLCVESNGQAGFQAAECADKNVKDVFVELDSMAQHVPITAQLNQVVTAFAIAPVENPGAGGGGPMGVKLRVQIGDQSIPHVNNTAMPPCTPPPASGDANFDDLKKLWFGTAAERGLAEPQRSKALGAKKLAFRYGLSVHNLTRLPITAPSPSGCAELPGNDFAMAVGSFGSGVHRNGVGPQEYWAGTFFHELVHNLGQRHGGLDNVNCKPNYLSIMSYTRQFKTVVTDRPLDLSRQELPTLTEASLNEPTGIVGPVGVVEQAPGAPPARTIFGPVTAKTASATGAINWNTPTNTTANDSGLNLNLNQIGSVSGCDGTGEPLVGHDDWANLVYNFRATVDFADGAYSSSDEALEVTFPQVVALEEATDADGDNIPDKLACAGAACVIDIVPGLSGNKVLLFNDHGVTKAIVPVAVLSSAVFDATFLNPQTLRFAGAPVARVHGQPICANVDVNRDRRKDLVCTYLVTGLSPGEQTAILEGMTVGGPPIAIAIRAEGTMLAVTVP